MNCAPSLPYFFSFNTYPYLQATVCLLPFQPSSFWKQTAKQQYQLWTAEGKRNSTFILQVFLKFNTVKYERQNRANTLDLNLWEMQYQEKKVKTFWPCTYLQKMYPSNICIEIINKGSLFKFSLTEHSKEDTSHRNWRKKPITYKNSHKYFLWFIKY